MLSISLLVLAASTSATGPIEVFDVQDWEARHVTVLAVKKSSESSRLVFSHPMPMKTSWSFLPNEVKDENRGWYQASFEPDDAKLDIFAREVTEFTYDVDTLTKGYAFRWVRTGVLPSRLTFVSQFSIRTAGRRLSSKFAIPQGAVVPENLLKQCKDIAEKAPASLRQLSRQIASQSRDEIDAVRKFSNWISKNIRYGYGPAPYDLNRIWDQRTGSCRRRSTVFRALCAEINIPAREARGYIIKSGETLDARNIGCHGWAEVYIRGAGWIEVEPATDGDAFSIPAAYVRNGYWENAWVESTNVELHSTGKDVMDDRFYWQRLK